ncbi:MAG: putative membrane protein [Rickettsiales bacterium]|jgi:uncharacterized membrane protein
MSFLNNLQNFLDDAKNNEIIDQETVSKLNSFAKQKNNSSANSNISIIFGAIGALAIVLGIILVVSYNWYEISKLVKISSFLLLLASVHCLAVILQNKFPKTANILHLLGAGLIIAGIGLIAQIYHISSSNGTAFLIWFILILPLALILKNQLITTLSVFALYSWIIIYLSNGPLFFKHALISATILATNLILIPLIFKSSSACFNQIKNIGGLILLITLAIAGFLGQGRTYDIADFSPLLLAIFSLNIIAIAIISFEKWQERGQLSTEIQGIALLALTMFFMVFSTFVNASVIPIFSWILWFAIGFWSIFYGLEIASKKYISLGVWLLAIGVMLRFFDIFGGMLKNGYAFVVCGIILVVVGFLTEKYRSSILQKLNTKNA